jgi:hypothetical protein
MSLTRRHLLRVSPVALVTSLPFLRSAPAGAMAQMAASAAPAQPPATFPQQPYDVVREVVGASHSNLARVKELVGRQPALARAAVDWGYGDWEDALGAASHVGNREIAEFLIAQGARPSIFSAAMLGQLDAVKAMIAASPGIEAIHGPHSITLLSHAMAGKAAAEPVVAYLKTLPDANRTPATAPMTAAEMEALAGTYVFGSGNTDRLLVTVTRGDLWMAREGAPARRLAHLGSRTFYPAGGTAVRITFAEQNGRLSVSVFDPDLLVTADRMR